MMEEAAAELDVVQKAIEKLEMENKEPRLLRLSPEFMMRLESAAGGMCMFPVDRELGGRVRVFDLPGFMDPTLGKDDPVVCEGIDRQAPPTMKSRQERLIRARKAYLLGEDPFEELLNLPSAEASAEDLDLTL